eukprot:1158400-Pelagomonas_calceolata.AAC.4
MHSKGIAQSINTLKSMHISTAPKNVQMILLTTIDIAAGMHIHALSPSSFFTRYSNTNLGLTSSA